MFKKIHSKRNPEDTLWTALSGEFSVYLDRLKSRIKMLLSAYPKQALAMMIILMAGSFFFTFIYKQPAAKTKAHSHAATANRQITRPVQDGFTQIISQADAMRETLRLKEEITLLLAQDSLSGRDSLRLERAIDRLHLLTLKTNPHGQH